MNDENFINNITVPSIPACTALAPPGNMNGNVTSAKIGKLAVHRSHAVKRKIEFPSTVTDALIGEIIVAEHKVR